MRYFGYITNGCVTFDKLCNLSPPPFHLLFFNPHQGVKARFPVAHSGISLIRSTKPAKLVALTLLQLEPLLCFGRLHRIPFEMRISS